MKHSVRRIALVPDRFALYRYPVFRLISERCPDGAEVVIYADPREDTSSIKLVSAQYCNMDLKSGGIRWQKVRSFYVGKICFWQTGLQKLAVRGSYRVIVYWGEAHRLSTWLSASMARLSGKKVVFWTHGIYGNEGYFKRKFRTLFYRLAHMLLLYGEHGRKQLELSGIPKERLYVINNSLNVQAQLQKIRSIDPAALNSIRREFCSDTEDLLVFVGRLEPQKNLSLLLQAVAILREQGKPIKALIIGDGSERGALVKQVKDLGIGEKIIFYGECYDDDVVLPLLAASDICVSPGEVGLTAMHALVSGTPVISHDDFPNQMPEFEAIRPGESGAFFRRGDAMDLVSKISACLADIEAGCITAEKCRRNVIGKYTPEFQNSVFYQAVAPLLF